MRYTADCHQNSAKVCSEPKRQMPFSARKAVMDPRMQLIITDAQVRLLTRIIYKRDPVIEKTMYGWRKHMISEKAVRFRFVQDQSFEETVRWFLSGDLVRKPE